jgi:hypothetical protein
MNTAPGTTLADAVDLLLTKLREHEEAAEGIRNTLRELRKRIVASGKRAGTKARSGRRRRRTPDEPAADATAAEGVN